MQHLRASGVLCFRREPEVSFLLMEHKDRFDLPKGHREESETDLVCALRELQEETGIRENQIDLDLDFRFEISYNPRYNRFGNEPVTKTVIIYLGILKEPVEIQTSEHLDFQWVKWNPPHNIQANTINPLLAAVEKYWSEPGRKPYI